MNDKEQEAFLVSMRGFWDRQPIDIEDAKSLYLLAVIGWVNKKRVEQLSKQIEVYKKELDEFMFLRAK